MNSLILFDGAYPSVSAGSKRVFYYKDGLSKNGINTDILSYYNKSNNSFTFYIGLIKTPFIVGYKFWKIKTKYDFLIVYGFDWLTYLFLCLICKIKKINILLEVNEKPGSVYGSKVTEFKPLKWFTTKMTYFSFRYFSGFIVISDSLLELVNHYKNSNSNVINIPILIDLERDKGNIEKPNLNFPYLLHTGALSEQKDGIIEVFEAFAMANKILDTNLHFYLTSNIAPTDVLYKINKIIADNKIENYIHFVSKLNEVELLSYQKYASLVIINKYTNEQNSNNFPTKLGEYLSLSVPVLTTAVGEMGKYLNSNNSVLFKEHDVVEMSNKIVEIVLNKINVKEISENGRNCAFKSFNHLIQTKNLAAFLRNFSEKHTKIHQ